MDERDDRTDTALQRPPKSKKDKKRVSSRAGAPTGASRPQPARGASPFRLYKPGQGAYVRWGTAGGTGLVALALASFLHNQMPNFTRVLWVQTLAPVAVLVVLAFVVFRLVGQSRSAVDFMIATEGEMKKVNWSTRREVFGATRVVIVTVLALGTVLFLVDIVFMTFFSKIGVLRIDVLGNLFGGAES